MVRAAGPSPQPDPVIDIQIDAADLPASRNALAAVVAADLGRRLAERASLPEGVFLAEDRQVVVELRPLPVPETDDVLVHVTVLLDGEKLVESTTDGCLSCSDVDVAEKALLLLEPLLQELPAPAPAPAPAPVIADEPEAEPIPELETPRPGQTLLISGGALLGVGVVGIGVGIGLIVVDERVISPPEALELEVVKYREVGIATVAIGGAAAVTGAVLLGLGLRERGRARVSAVPVLGPRVVGLSLSGRF